MFHLKPLTREATNDEERCFLQFRDDCTSKEKLGFLVLSVANILLLIFCVRNLLKINKLRTETNFHSRKLFIFNGIILYSTLMRILYTSGASYFLLANGMNTEVKEYSAFPPHWLYLFSYEAQIICLNILMVYLSGKWITLILLAKSDEFALKIARISKIAFQVLTIILAASILVMFFVLAILEHDMKTMSPLLQNIFTWTIMSMNVIIGTGFVIFAMFVIQQMQDIYTFDSGKMDKIRFIIIAISFFIAFRVLFDLYLIFFDGVSRLKKESELADNYDWPLLVTFFSLAADWGPSLFFLIILSPSNVMRKVTTPGTENLGEAILEQFHEQHNINQSQTTNDSNKIPSQEGI